MTFEEYTSSEKFRRHIRRLGMGKRLRMPFLIAIVLGVVLMAPGLICWGFVPDVNFSSVVNGVLIALCAIGGVLVFASTFAGGVLSGRDDNGRRQPVYGAALLLYARDHLSHGVGAENGVIDCVIECSFSPSSKTMTGAAMACPRRQGISLEAFEGTLEASDLKVLCLYAVFDYMERTALAFTSFAVSACINEEMSKKHFLLRGGKWTWSGRSWKWQYRYLKRYARRKRLIDA